MAQLKIQITPANGIDGSSQVYLTQANELLLALQNQTGGALQMSGGAPQNPPPAGGPSALALDLSSLFADPAQQAGLTVAAQGWTAQYFADRSSRCGCWPPTPRTRGGRWKRSRSPWEG